MDIFAAWTYFGEIPDEQYLEKDFGDFLAFNERFHDGIKVVKAFWEHSTEIEGKILTHRQFQATDKYEEPEASDIYAHCSTEEVAAAIAEMCFKYAVKRGIHINGISGSIGMQLRMYSHGTLIVYVMRLKPKTQQCYFCEKYYAENRKQHIIECHLDDVTKIVTKRADLIRKKLHETEEGKEILGIFARMLSWYDVDPSDEE
jgi:hypothetical protein